MKKKKLGILLATPPQNKNWVTVVNLAQEAIQQGIEAYLYLIDDGVHGTSCPEITVLTQSGVNLFVCAYSIQRRGIPFDHNTPIAYSGLVALSDLIKGCDRFITFT